MSFYLRQFNHKYCFGCVEDALYLDYARIEFGPWVFSENLSGFDWHIGYYFRESMHLRQKQMQRC
jgi:hypothetical protein